MCPVCREAFEEWRIDAHHVLRKERIRRYVAGLMLPEGEERMLLERLLWDPRNGMPVHDDCHQRHTKRTVKISAALLDSGHRAFAEELGLGYVLERDYA